MWRAQPAPQGKARAQRQHPCSPPFSPVPEDHVTEQDGLQHPAEKPMSCWSLPNLMLQFYCVFRPSYAGLSWTLSRWGHLQGQSWMGGGAGEGTTRLGALSTERQPCTSSLGSEEMLPFSRAGL